MSMFKVETKSGWKPPTILPSLRDVKRLALDVESTGKNKHQDKMVGLAIRTDTGIKQYLPFAHEGGGNLDEKVVKRWAQKELRNKHIVNLNTGYDAEMMARWGADIEQQGCTVSDIAFSAALLNEHRYSGLDLNSLGLEYCGRGKLKTGVEPDRIAEYPAGDVGPYAENDADLAWEVDQVTQPLIDADDLRRVYDLENGIIYAVNYMERNAARIDVAKLRGWEKEAADKYANIILDIYSRTKLRVNPDSGKSMHDLFEVLRIDQPSDYQAATLKKIDNACVKLAMRAKHYASLGSKYLTKYRKAIRGGDILRFALHQLKTDEYGTITGRFSSANVNIQQVMKVEKQIEEFGDEFIIRELFIPDDGFDFFAADASQIEFRIFAHYSGSSRLIQLYRDNPNIDFHQIVADMIGQERTPAKHNNFGKLYGMGLPKLCARLGCACTCGEVEQFWKHESHFDECPAHRGLDVAEEYDQEFPEAKRLLNQASDIAKRRGYVKTYLGRRGRFDPKRGTGFHAALNKVIQGTAADYNKMKIKSVYENREHLGIHKMRMTVHDEICGDIDRDPKYKKRLSGFLDEQELPLKVPLLWKVSTGANWKECA